MLAPDTMTGEAGHRRRAVRDHNARRTRAARVPSHSNLPSQSESTYFPHSSLLGLGRARRRCIGTAKNSEVFPPPKMKTTFAAVFVVSLAPRLARSPVSQGGYSVDGRLPKPCRNNWTLGQVAEHRGWMRADTCGDPPPLNTLMATGQGRRAHHPRAHNHNKSVVAAPPRDAVTTAKAVCCAAWVGWPGFGSN